MIATSLTPLKLTHTSHMVITEFLAFQTFLFQQFVTNCSTSQLGLDWINFREAWIALVASTFGLNKQISFHQSTDTFYRLTNYQTSTTTLTSVSNLDLKVGYSKTKHTLNQSYCASDCILCSVKWFKSWFIQVVLLLPDDNSLWEYF